ncbi:OB-fold putative lipoprotein [Arenibacter sp. F26102]|uniref:OB-fold putative lipoprotein n=1 Tax=Arenibacter sp. F26102 TaxID=2926416 RepID=UPI001FF1B4AF|nr:OB-fold putative lipoprotein [Arenibacter sp. F26102]MCK0144748.1 OB-fold putative lipoprotein [Arenibacter sp. F26102]
MTGKKFKIILSLLVLVIIGLVVSFLYYNKPHANIEKSKSDYSLTANQLIKEYKEQGIEAEKKYSERIIQVQGQIHKISTLKGNSVITLQSSDSESSVICHMLPEENANVLKLKNGQEIMVKGKCTGFLLDVIMVRCILVE